MAPGGLITVVKTPQIVLAYCSKDLILIHLTVQNGQAGVLFHVVSRDPRFLPSCGSSLLQAHRAVSFHLEKEYENRAEEVFMGWIWKRHLLTFHWLGINFMATLGNLLFHRYLVSIY